MKIIAAVMIAFALILVALPSSDAENCFKGNMCMSKKGLQNDTDTLVDCPGKCAGWGCLKDNVMYAGAGCEDDDRGACKDATNIVSKTCSGDAIRKGKIVPCGESEAYKGLYSVVGGDFDLEHYADVVCEPIKVNVKPVPSKDESKVGVMAVGGMMILGWMVAQF